jgi:hypothetical protein
VDGIHISGDKSTTIDIDASGLLGECSTRVSRCMCMMPSIVGSRCKLLLGMLTV